MIDPTQTGQPIISSSESARRTEKVVSTPPTDVPVAEVLEKGSLDPVLEEEE